MLKQAPITASPITRDEVLSLMASSKSPEQWDLNADIVKQLHNNQYPDYWFNDMIMSGLADHVLKGRLINYIQEDTWHDSK